MLFSGPRITANQTFNYVQILEISVEHFLCLLGSIAEKPEEFKFDVHNTLTVCFVNLTYFNKNLNARCCSEPSVFLWFISKVEDK